MLINILRHVIQDIVCHYIIRHCIVLFRENMESSSNASSITESCNSLTDSGSNFDGKFMKNHDFILVFFVYFIYLMKGDNGPGAILFAWSFGYKFLLKLTMFFSTIKTVSRGEPLPKFLFFFKTDKVPGIFMSCRSIGYKFLLKLTNVFLNYKNSL